MARLLGYMPGTDYRLPSLNRPQNLPDSPTGYYVFSQVIDLDKIGFAKRFGGNIDLTNDKNFSALKYKAARETCIQMGVKYPEEVERGSQTGVNNKTISRDIRETTSPIRKFLERTCLEGESRGSILEHIARKYSPGSVEQTREGMQKILLMFEEIYALRREGFLMPRGEQLVSFFSQVFDLQLGGKLDQLKILMVTCPKYNEPGSLSDTANAYLNVLPKFTSILSKYGIPFMGKVLVDDAEERVAGGQYLSRMGMTEGGYRLECNRNVELVKSVVSRDKRMRGISVYTVGNAFPEFKGVVGNLEKQLYELCVNNLEFRRSMIDIAGSRLARHTKILGGQCDFSDSVYLTLHYAAEYMAVGYLCRARRDLGSQILLINYNSPNVDQFNNKDVLSSCVKNGVPSEFISVPTFQVKLY